MNALPTTRRQTAASRLCRALAFLACACAISFAGFASALAQDVDVAEATLSPGESSASPTEPRVTAASTARATATTVRVAVYAEPSDARILVDGELVAEGRFVGALPPGAHRIEISRAGYTTSIKEVQLDPGDGALHLAVDLRPTSTTTVIPVGRTGGFVDEFDSDIAAWSFTGGGAVLAVAGIVLLALDGSETCAADAPGPCPEVFETTAAGGVLLGVGMAALTTGVVLFLWDELAGSRPRAVEPNRESAAGLEIESIGVAPSGMSNTTDGGVLFIGGRF